MLEVSESEKRGKGRDGKGVKAYLNPPNKEEEALEKWGEEEREELEMERVEEQ